MITKRTVARIIGTVTCALSIGFVMQRSESLPVSANRLAADTARPVANDPVLPAEGPYLELQEISLTSASFGPDAEEGSDIVLKVASLGVIPLPDMPDEPEPPKVVCSVLATAVPAPRANVDLTVSAPCLKNQRSIIHHNGMMFSQTTDADGNLKVRIPALAGPAVIVVDFPGQGSAVAKTDVPDLSEVERVVLQWVGDGGFRIHAFEFGADYGDQGHVWSGAPQGDLKHQGRVVRLGDGLGPAARIAEIYSLPKGSVSQTGNVTLSVEAEVNGTNCGRKIAAQSLEIRDRGSMQTRDLVLTMPGCDAVGDYLVLNNLFDDLKIAAR